MSSDQEILVTVIVPTYARSALLRELVESLHAQTLDPKRYEIIVVDDCSQDDTPQVLHELQQKSPCRMTCLRNEENKGPIYSRNCAARIAQAPILAFTDSDCRVSPQWLEKGLAAFSRQPELAFVAGPVLDKPEQPIRFFSLPNGTQPGENPVYPTWNIFYNKKVFWDLDGFDEAAWYGNVGDRPIDCSDSDFALKVKRLGYPYLFVEDMLVYHEVWQAKPIDWLKAFRRLIYVPALLKRHPELRPKILWWGPFLSKGSLYFYVALAGLLAIPWLGPWSLLLTVPHFWSVATVPGGEFTLLRLPRFFGRIAFLTLRQMVSCWSLLTGSIRMRTLVL